jgi:hypothetical protein
MICHHEQPQRQIEPKARWVDRSIVGGLVGVLVIMFLVQATKKISISRTATEHMPVVHVTPAPGAEYPSPSETTETTGQR